MVMIWCFLKKFDEQLIHVMIFFFFAVEYVAMHVYFWYFLWTNEQ